MEGYSMKQAQYIQRGRSEGRGYLPAKVHMRARDTRRVIGLNRALAEYTQDTELVSKGEMPVVERTLELCQWQRRCAHKPELVGFVPMNRNTERFNMERVNTQTVESPWKAIR
jgi:hypothetical protein